MSGEAFSESSAQDTQLAAAEAKEWIEAVTGKRFKNASIRESLEDGVLLCEFMNKINPDFIRKINKSKSPIAYLDNIQQFLRGCQDLGMKDAQLFDTMDLQDIRGVRKAGVKRDETDRRIRAVCITLYWLGRTVAELDEYDGPQLDLDLFKRLMEGNLSDEEDELEEADYSHKVEKVRDYPTINHFQMQEETRSPTPTANSNELATTSSPQENGLTLTFEQEQTADELLADIQNAVDEMLENFQFGPVAPTVPPQPMKKPDTKREKMKNESSVSASAGDDKTNGGSGSATQMAGHTVKMRSRNGGFGFQVMGGMDSEIPAQVDYIVPGSAAEDSGLEVGDILICVNGLDVFNLSHVDLVGVIKKAGWTGEVVIGVSRAEEIRSNKDASPGHTHHDNANNVPDAMNFSRTESREKWEEENEERMRQAQEIALLYPQRNGGGIGSIDNGIGNGPPPTYGREPLPTLVEHMEEALFEQIQEIMDSASPPPPLEVPPSTLLQQRYHSETPPTDHSPFTPVSPLQDDMESIERELQELALMDTGNQAQDYDLSDSASEEAGQVPNKQKVGMQKTAADTAAIKFNSFEVEESISPLPLSPVPEIPLHVEIRQIEANSSQETLTISPPLLYPPVASPQDEEPEISLDEQLDELRKFAESTSQPVPLPVKTKVPPLNIHFTEECVTPPPRFDSPPPPKPKSEAPKRVAKRPAPPPPTKSKPKQTTQNKASTPVNEPTPAINGKDSLPLLPVSSPEHVSSNNTQRAHTVHPNEPSSPEVLPTSPTHDPITQHVLSPVHAPTPQEYISSPKHTPSPEHAPNPQEYISSPPSPEHAPSPQEYVSSPKHSSSPVSSPLHASSPLLDSFMATELLRSDSPDLVTQMKELAYSKTITIESSKPLVVTSQSEAATSTQANPYTMKQQNGQSPGRSIQNNDSKHNFTPQTHQQQQHVIPFTWSDNRSNSLNSNNLSSGPAAIIAPPINIKHVDSNTPETIEIMGGIKIQRVQKTRWTPKSNSMESSPAYTPDQTVPVLTSQHQRQERSATLPNSYLHKKKTNSSPSYVTRRQVEMNDSWTKSHLTSAPVVVARGIGGVSGGVGIGEEQKRGTGQQPHFRNSNSYQPHTLHQQHHQPWRSQEELRNRRVNPGSQQPKHATTPDGKKTSVQTNNGFSRGAVEDWKNNRSKTWSTAKDTVKDGYQIAYAMRAKNPYDLCSRCHQPLGQETVLSLPALKTQYHIKCFTCRVCRSPLGQVGAQSSTTIMMKNKRPHCRYCGSSDDGMLTTEC